VGFALFSPLTFTQNKNLTLQFNEVKRAISPKARANFRQDYKHNKSKKYDFSYLIKNKQMKCDVFT